jgi:hypothetical protein
VVSIWNPHGNKFIPKGPNELTNGFTTIDGNFSMTLAEFVKAFRSMSMEGVEPASYHRGCEEVKQECPIILQFPRYLTAAFPPDTVAA